MDALRDVRVVGAFWVAIRLFLAYVWLKEGIGKLGNPAWTGEKAGDAVKGFLNGALSKTTGEFPEVQGWYAWFITHVALPNAMVFNYLVVAGEIAVGAALLVGLATRFAALMGAVMNLTFWTGDSAGNPTMLVLGLVIALVGARAGYYGLDRYAIPYLARRTGLPGR